MKENKCKHERIHIDELGKDMLGICDDCGELFQIYNIKEGLYIIEYKNKVYLLNTEKDMELINKPHNIMFNDNIVCLYNNLNTTEDYSYTKQLRKISK